MVKYGILGFVLAVGMVVVVVVALAVEVEVLVVVVVALGVVVVMLVILAAILVVVVVVVVHHLKCSTVRCATGVEGRRKTPHRTSSSCGRVHLTTSPATS